MNIFGKKSELEKINKKINTLNKEIDVINKSLIKQYNILDKDKSSLQRSKNKKEQYKKKFDELINSSQLYRNGLMKNLSEKLKLSAKFAATNKY